MSDVVFRLWWAGKERFAVTAGEEPVPVIGFVTRQSRKTWIAERGGKIFPKRYDSADDAAQALINLAKSVEDEL